MVNGKYSGLQKKIQDVAPHAHYVHYASHNLNLVAKDDMEAVTVTRQFCDTIESVYNFFGHSIVRWQKLQNVHDRSCSNVTLKALNPIWWSGRYDAVYASKEKFCDVIKCLTHIILISTKPKERDKAMAIKKQIKTLALYQVCGVGGLRMGGVGVGVLRMLRVGVGFFCPTPIPETQLFFFKSFACIFLPAIQGKIVDPMNIVLLSDNQKDEAKSSLLNLAIRILG